MKKQNKFWTYPLMIMGLALMLTSSCKKEEEKNMLILTTSETTSITPTTATSGGSVTSDGGAAITERGVCYSTTQSPNLANRKVAAAGTIGPFTCSLVGLVPATTYYVRAYATNSKGVAYGNEIRFTTAFDTPTLITTEVTLITTTTATSGGSVTSDGGTAITERGVCYGTTQSPNTANSKVAAAGTIGLFTCSLVGLAPVTIYYLRTYATNSVGTAYGSQVRFTTFDSNAIIDAGGNLYNTATIGTQTWMKENLKTTKYRNGDPIPNITTDNTVWLTQTAGAYCWYNNDITNKTTYGVLYNWYTVVDTRQLCPTGWHIPTYDEWTTLTTYLGGEAVAGGKLKENGTTLWASPNTGADNTTGFSALPGGLRDSPGYFYDIGGIGYWWSSSDYTSLAWCRSMHYDGCNVYSQFLGKNCGASVRCVRD